jgi:hypothetical protein
MWKNNDPRLVSEDELRAFVEDHRNVLDLDFQSAAFKSLPIDLQHEIIMDQKLKSRQTSWNRLTDMIESAPTALDFSKKQIENLVYRNFMTETMSDFSKNANIVVNPSKQDRKFSGRVETRRIASEKSRQYVLIKNDGDQGPGWKMQFNRPVKKDVPHNVQKITVSQNVKTMVEKDVVLTAIPNAEKSDSEEEFIEVIPSFPSETNNAPLFDDFPDDVGEDLSTSVDIHELKDVAKESSPIEKEKTDDTSESPYEEIVTGSLSQKMSNHELVQPVTGPLSQKMSNHELVQPVTGPLSQKMSNHELPVQPVLIFPQPKESASQPCFNTSHPSLPSPKPLSSQSFQLHNIHQESSNQSSSPPKDTVSKPDAPESIMTPPNIATSTEIFSKSSQELSSLTHLAHDEKTDIMDIEENELLELTSVSQTKKDTTTVTEDMILETQVSFLLFTSRNF